MSERCFEVFRGWIRKRWLIAFAIPFEPNKRAGCVTGSTRRGGNLLNVRIVSRFFFAGSGGCSVSLAGWQETPPWGLAAWVQHGIRGPVGGFSAAFRASPLLFAPFLRLRDASGGPIVAFSASQGRKRCSGAPWRRFLPRNCCSLGSIRRDCIRPSEGESSPRWRISLLRGRVSLPW